MLGDRRADPNKGRRRSTGSVAVSVEDHRARPSRRPESRRACRPGLRPSSPHQASVANAFAGAYDGWSRDFRSIHAQGGGHHAGTERDTSSAAGARAGDDGAGRRPLAGDEGGAPGRRCRWRCWSRQDDPGRRPGASSRGARVHRRRGSLSRHRGRDLVRTGDRGSDHALGRDRGRRLSATGTTDARVPRPRDAERCGAAQPPRGPAPDRPGGRCLRAGAAGAGGPALGGHLDPRSRRRALPHRAGSTAVRAHGPDRRPASPAPGPEGAGRDRPGLRGPTRRARSPGPGPSIAGHRGGDLGSTTRSGAGPFRAGAIGGQPALRRGDRRRRAGSGPGPAVRPLPRPGRRVGRWSA